MKKSHARRPKPNRLDDAGAIRTADRPHTEGHHPEGGTSPRFVGDAERTSTEPSRVSQNRSLSEPGPQSDGRSSAGTPPSPAATISDDVIRAARRNWRIVAAVAIGTMLLAWLITALQPKRYRVVAIAAVGPVMDQMSPSEVLKGVEVLDRRVIVASLAALASAPMIQRSLPAGGYEVDAAVLPNTNLFRIEVEGASSQRAAQIANAIPGLLSRHAQAMYTLYGVTLVSPAVPDAEPLRPRAARAAAVGLILGLMAGVAAAWLLDRRRRA